MSATAGESQHGPVGGARLRVEVGVNGAEPKREPAQRAHTIESTLRFDDLACLTPKACVSQEPAEDERSGP